MTFSPTESLRLAAAFAEAHKQATPGEWSVWTSNSVRRITAERRQDGGVLSAVTTRDGMPDLHGNNRDRDLASICTFRNNAASASAQLAAAVERVEELERQLATPPSLRVLTEAQIREALNEGAAESRAAQGDNAWASLLKQRDSLRARLAAVTALAVEACDLADYFDTAIRGPQGEKRNRERLAAIRADLAKGTP